MMILRAPQHRALRFLLFTPLLAIGPALGCSSSYLFGRFTSYPDEGDLLSDIAILLLCTVLVLLPFVIALVISGQGGTSCVLQTALYLGALVGQCYLWYEAAPAIPRFEMMGRAAQFRHEFSCTDIWTCAEKLRHKAANGTLVLDRSKKGHTFPGAAASELPDSLRGRFEAVWIARDMEGHTYVDFSISGYTGILCDRRRRVWSDKECSMADYVHAYRWERR